MLVTVAASCASGARSRSAKNIALTESVHPSSERCQATRRIAAHTAAITSAARAIAVAVTPREASLRRR
jgi:hypothetical protein